MNFHGTEELLQILFQDLWARNRKIVRADFYFKVILPSVTYGLVVWSFCGNSLFDELEKIHVHAARTIMAWIGTHPAIRSQPKASDPLLKIYTNIDYLC